MTKPLVSIITPTYNHENYIERCIKSVLSQTYNNWEQIIIDDGSSDNTANVIAQYKDQRIKYVKQKNAGIWKLSDTYNKALQMSQGELIAVLEGDDFWSPMKLERQLQAFDRQDTVLSWGRAAVINSKGNIIDYAPNSNKWFHIVERKEVLRKLLFQNFIPACTVMCRKDALFAIKGFQQPQGVPSVDYATWLKLSLIGQVTSINEVLGFWRLHEKQSSSIWKTELSFGNRQYGITFFKELPQETRDALNVGINELNRAYQCNIASMNFYLGRVALSEGKWVEGRENLRKTFHNSTIPLKVKALLGIVCSYFHLDLEWAVKIMGRPRLSELN
jgi:glycosyltransferase involved in cell wall biosynthesis